MKTRLLSIVSILAFVGLVTFSCVESSKKYKSLVAQRDSLAKYNTSLEADYSETVNILNDIEDGFAAIREKEGLIKNDISNIEGQSTSKRQKIATDVAQIQQLVEDNKEKISKLQKLLDKSGSQNKVLKEAVARMESELKEKSELLVTLQDDLSKKDVQIQELSGVVEKLNTDLTDLTEVSKQQIETIKNQDTDLNKVWYCIASERDLKDAGIVSNAGLFAKKKLFAGEFDKNLLNEVDLRECTVIPTNSKRIKILSSHPDDSYTLEEGEDGLITINITSPEKFWSVSKYLVVKN